MLSLKYIFNIYRILETIDDVGDPKNNSAGMTCQPRTDSQLVIAQVGEETKILTLLRAQLNIEALGM